MSAKIVKIISTFFGVGYLPFFPGTWASLLALGMYLVLKNYLVFYLVISFVILCIGFIFAGRAEILFDKKDSRYIVIDEIAAVLIMCLIIPNNLFSLSLAFIMFRLLDIIKPFTIKKIESFPGSYGIMLDDLTAMSYACIVIWLINLIIGGKSG